MRQSLFTAGAMSLCRPETAELSSSPSESSESLSSLMLPFTMKVATCWDNLCGQNSGSHPACGNAAAHRKQCALLRSCHGVSAKTSSFHAASLV